MGGSTLRLPELEQNGLSDPSALYKLLYEGKGRMPGFGEECAPKVSTCTADGPMSPFLKRNTVFSPTSQHHRLVPPKKQAEFNMRFRKD